MRPKDRDRDGGQREAVGPGLTLRCPPQDADLEWAVVKQSFLTEVEQLSR